MATFTYDLGKLVTNPTIYPNFRSSLNPFNSANQNHLFKDFDKMLNMFINNPYFRGHWFIPFGNNIYLFLCPNCTKATFNFFTKNLAVGDSIGVAITQIDVSDFDIPSWTVLPTIPLVAATLTPAQNQWTLETGIIANGLLLTFVPHVYAGALEMYAFFLNNKNVGGTDAVYPTKVTLSSANLLAGGPITVIPAVPGYIIKPIDIFCKYKFLTAAYVGGTGVLTFNSASTAIGSFVTADILHAITNVNQQAVPIISGTPGGMQFVADDNYQVNFSAGMVAGLGSCDLSLWYRLIPNI